MQPAKSSRHLVVSSAAAAAVFASSSMRRLLLRFVGRGKSISDVARSSGLDIRHVHYLVHKLTRLGLLDVVEVRRRAGRPIKIYRCVRDSFYIPLDAMRGPVSGGLNKELDQCLASDAARSIAGIVFTTDSEGRPVGRWVSRDGKGSGPLDSWRILRLEPRRFAELKSELLAVLQKFQASPSPTGPVYLVHVAAAPRLADSRSVDNPISTLP